ncbi:hypothetical protein G9F73_019455 [Clostridium estertheticum]|uniref:hypothetical protein n=1 Tax=Clostridium estertheticum TaxID=238834 RepID=UPI001CCE6A87|nr:hypothetical protein [Clostridium estertheticum]MBZ9609905.1 hypothetical protein [Clostridium estertheticum]
MMYMLKIIYQICCSIDIHKKFVVATIASTDKSNVTTYSTKQFNTYTRDIQKLK